MKDQQGLVHVTHGFEQILRFMVNPYKFAT